MPASDDLTTVLLTRIDPYLQRIAYDLARQSGYLLDVDDLAQEMRLYICAGAKRDPHLLAQTDGFIARGAAWHARHYIRHGYTRMLDGQRIAWADPIDEAMHLADDALPLEVGGISDDLAAVIEALPDSLRRTIGYLGQGYKQYEIAALLGVTPQAVSAYVRKCKAALSAYA